ncbi:hypothetical protein Fmac_011092 [Flemingia macrophylla]|uniref:Uncharacterized protein n=1 Tax=Flemingia macrophylla TaxID=520843 RepID=A0ABD1MLR9_9FABA
MEMLVSKGFASSSPSYAEPLKSDYCLCLAIHAPRKGILEIWQMRTGPRLRTISCARGSKMLQPSYRFGASMSSPYVPLEVFLLNGDSSILDTACSSKWWYGTITGIGSFDLPSYDIEVTPFLGTLLDGGIHSVGFIVTNVLNVWFIDVNLHLWLDGTSSTTEGELVELVDKPLSVSLVFDFEGLIGSFMTSAKRSIFCSGWIRSSYGNINASFVQDFVYNNSMVLEKNGDEETVNQMILFNDSVRANLPLPFVDDRYGKFSIYFYGEDEPGQEDDTTFSITNVTLGFDKNKYRSSTFGVSKSALKKVHDGRATMVIRGNLVVRGHGETQDYSYTSDGYCYFREVGSPNYAILYDKVRHSCNKRSHYHDHGLNSIKRLFTM